MLDEAVEATTHPLIERHDAGDPNATTTLRYLGVFLMDVGCGVVARAGMELTGLDVAVIVAQERAHASAEVENTLISDLRACAEKLGAACVELHNVAHALAQDATTGTGEGRAR
ncbi:hypothetical protein B1813_22340 [Saccharomonospora piscinae]|uniref:Uncharacterized protein n=1 Tax=Saccharomonospora piscinae TaxID=687388 RepID=A0A1V8ZXW6_SACPI|nr:hypothetical protein B1813_22340 [Saccharomonospora piscinae]